MATEFFTAEEVFRMTRAEWARATDLPESTPVEQLVAAFRDQNLRKAFEEEELFTLNWRPIPTLAQEEVLLEELRDKARSMSIETQIVEVDGKIVATYFMTLGIEVENPDRPDLDQIIEKRPNAWPLTWSMGLAAGFISSTFVKPKSAKWTIGITAGIIAAVGVNKLLTQETEEKLV